MGGIQYTWVWVMSYGVGIGVKTLQSEVRDA